MSVEKLAGRSVVILMPTYNDWLSVAHLLPALDKVVGQLGMTGQVILIDDSSTELAGREAIPQLALAAISSVEEITLTRNQGNQRAIAVGLAYVAANLTADYLIVMDSDGEDRPEDIPGLLARCAGTGDRKVVFAERTRRSEGFTFRAGYYAYQWIFNAATGSRISMGNFSAIPAALLQPIANIAELWSHFPVSIMRARIPFEQVPTQRGKRLFGTTSMRIVPLIAHAFGGFAIYADLIAARGLLLAAVLSVVIVAAAILVVILRLTTNVMAFGSSSILVGLLAVILLQVFAMAGTLLFIVSWLRMQPPMIPARNYSQFIVKTTRLWGTPSATTSGPPGDGSRS